ncbi:MAG: methylaspartate mutase subunit E, partial [Nitrososphaeria archaeon]|nr:methylaspartate mutase subunit E [Nitrososphaeria archaeon]NIN51651.1 methylaspartate mutase subunit E [Nitrososphaeria archaeon]NIQ32136.1 methylaspartate mutase subunit E [Nitrososphaeria archaeon]
SLTGTIIPPSLSIVVSIVESLLAAEQGVKYRAPAYEQCSNLVQDVAATMVMNKLCKEYLNRFGYTDTEIYPVFFQWMGLFPPDIPQAYALICIGSATAILGRACKIVTKTYDEPRGIPSKEANAECVRATKATLSLLKSIKLPISVFEEEMEITEEATRQIMDKIIEMGDGDVAVGIARACEAGVYDQPFVPAAGITLKGKVLPARDAEAAVRFLKFGALPLSDDIKRFHEKKMEERRRMEGKKPDYMMALDDLYATEDLIWYKI